MLKDFGQFIGRLRERSPRQTEIPLPVDRVALLDLDGTLIDDNYQLNDPGINSAIATLQSQGWKVGLSSDTPLKGLQVWAERFGMNGPLIAEKGAIVEVDGKTFVDESDEAAFLESRTKIEERLAELGVKIWEGNPAEAIRDGLKIGNSGDIYVLVNTLRTCSLGLFVREVDQSGNLYINNELTTSLIDELRDLFPPFDDLQEDLNHTFGLLIASRGKVAKRFGTQALMQEQGLKQVAMIGNSMTDYIGSDIALHYAVSNASDEFKSRCNYVAQSPTTSGVVEILGKLAQQRPPRRARN